MKCNQCDSLALVHTAKVVNGQVEEHHLCLKCATGEFAPSDFTGPSDFVAPEQQIGTRYKTQSVMSINLQGKIAMLTFSRADAGMISVSIQDGEKQMWTLVNSKELSNALGYIYYPTEGRRATPTKSTTSRPGVFAFVARLFRRR